MTGIGQTWRLAVAAAALVLLTTSPAPATMKYGPLELSGNLQSQNIIRNPDVDEYHLVQQRNTMRARVDWAWLEQGKWLDRIEPPVHRELEVLPALPRRLRQHLRLPRQSTVNATSAAASRAVPPTATWRILDTGALNALKFENQLARSCTSTSKMADIPVSFRLGKQQIIWGEADDFRMLDRANPLDTSWHYIMEIPPPSFGWDDLRIPLWMVKGLWDIGNIGGVLSTPSWRSTGTRATGGR